MADDQMTDAEHAKKIKLLTSELNDSAKAANDAGLQVIFRTVDARCISGVDINLVSVEVSRPL